MRRVALVVAAMTLMVGLVAAVAYAATIEGTNQHEILVESPQNDKIFGRGGNDEIRANMFGPAFNGPSDRDVANGNAGLDHICVDDGDGRDTAYGGRGNDTCVTDPGDTRVSC